MAEFTLSPPAGESDGSMRAVATVGDRVIASSTRVIDYPHFPAQTLFPASEARLVRSEIKTLAHTVGYMSARAMKCPRRCGRWGAR